jgi:hypothetical protein
MGRNGHGVVVGDADPVEPAGAGMAQDRTWFQDAAWRDAAMDVQVETHTSHDSKGLPQSQNLQRSQNIEIVEMSTLLYLVYQRSAMPQLPSETPFLFPIQTSPINSNHLWYTEEWSGTMHNGQPSCALQWSFINVTGA